MGRSREPEASGPGDGRASRGRPSRVRASELAPPAAAMIALQRSAGNAAAREVIGGHDAIRALARADQPEATKPAEVVRLEDEIRKHAASNAWSGVVRDYAKLEEIGSQHADRRTHLSAAQGEQTVNGATKRYLELLSRTIDGPAFDHDDAAVQQAREMRTFLFETYREVLITREGGGGSEDEGGGGGLFGGLFGGGAKDDEEPAAPAVELSRDPMPFASTERIAIEAAARALTVRGWFRGFLPFGSYTLNGTQFTVEQGIAPLEISY